MQKPLLVTMGASVIAPFTGSAISAYRVASPAIKNLIKATAFELGAEMFDPNSNLDGGKHNRAGHPSHGRQKSIPTLHIK